MQKRISTIPFTDTPEQHEKLLAVIESLKNEKGAVMAALHKAQDIYGYLPIEVQKEIHAVSMYLSKRSTAFPRSILSSRSLRRVSTTFPFASAPHATLRAQIRFLTVSLQSSASSREEWYAGRRVLAHCMSLHRRLRPCTGPHRQRRRLRPSRSRGRG